MPFYASGGGITTSGTLSGSLGFTINWAKVGKIVTLVIANDTTRIPNGNSNVTTALPSNLIPEIYTSVDCIRSYTNKCTFSVGTNGTVVVYCDIPTGTSSPYYVTAVITYIAKE